MTAVLLVGAKPFGQASLYSKCDDAVRSSGLAAQRDTRLHHQAVLQVSAARNLDRIVYGGGIEAGLNRRRLRGDEPDSGGGNSG